MPHHLQGDSEQADRDAYRALACAADVEAYLALPDILECLATLAGATGSHREAAGLFGAADALRQRVGAVRFKIYDAEHESAVASFRNALGDADFERAWAEGAELSTGEAVAYAERGRAECKRSASGWASLTPTELHVVRSAADGAELRSRRDALCHQIPCNGGEVLGDLMTVRVRLGYATLARTPRRPGCSPARSCLRAPSTAGRTNRGSRAAAAHTRRRTR